MAQMSPAGSKHSMRNWPDLAAKLPPEPDDDQTPR
jgi:hypothetical protein